MGDGLSSTLFLPGDNYKFINLYIGISLTNTVKEGMSGILLHDVPSMPSQADSILCLACVSSITKTVGDHTHITLTHCNREQLVITLPPHSHTTTGSCPLTGYLDA